MRRKVLGTALLLFGLALGLLACSPPPQTLQGKVYTSPRAGGQPVHGAKVVVRAGNQTQEVLTGLDGSFQLRIPGNAQTFNLTVIPPKGQGMAALTYEEVPVAAYRSPYGAASEMNIYLPAPASSLLPGYPARRGLIQGTLTLNGAPVQSTTPRPADFSRLFDPPRPGEDGLVVFGGFRTVTTGTGGAYTIPVVSTNNLYAASGSLWAGNYTGTDTGDPNTATEYFWSHFQYIPEVRVYLGASSPFPTTSQDVALEAFDPASNPRVTLLPVQHDYSALGGFTLDPSNPGWNAFAFSVPSFVHAIHSGEVELGQYYFLGENAKSLRVYKIPQGTASQQIQVLHVALRFDESFQVKDLSLVYTWRDGTNLDQAITARFLDTPKLAVADGATLSSTPTLSWQGVSGAQIYVVSVYDGDGNLVWAGFTPKTSTTIPFPLASGATYFWDVYTNDQDELVDYIGKSPEAIQARLHLNLGHLAKLERLRPSPVNAYREKVARALMEASQTPMPEAAYQRLLQNGYRESVSETRTFTVQ
jgi:hypothetical protein